MAITSSARSSPSTCGFMLPRCASPNDIAADTSARGPRAHGLAVARRSGGFGLAQRERDGARERRLERSTLRAHGAAQGARAARLRRLLHELWLAQGCGALVDAPS